MSSTRKRSAVSRVRNSAGKFVSMPSSSMPPKGGLVTMTSTRSFGRPVAQRAGQGVVVPDVGRHVDAVQQQLVMQRRCGRCFFSMPGKQSWMVALVGLGLGLLAEVLDGADEEAAGAAGGVEDGFAEPGIDLLDDELGDGARGVVLAGVAGGLEVLEDLLVDVAEQVAVLGGVEVDAVDLVDDLPHQRAVLHVVVGILEGHADERRRSCRLPPVSVLSFGQERVVDEVEQRVAGDAFGVGGPVRQRRCCGSGERVVVAEELQFLLAVVEDLEEEHPAELVEALGVAVGAGVLAHDVLDGFDEVGDVGHGSGCLLVELRFRVRGWRRGSSSCRRRA